MKPKCSAFYLKEQRLTQNALLFLVLYPLEQMGDPSVVTAEDDELTLVDNCYIKV